MTRSPIRLTLLWLAGVIGWWWFLGAGTFNAGVFDWQMQHAYDTIWAMALRAGTLPWTTATPLHDTTRFLGNPETPLDPLILLTRWCDPATVDLIRFLALYTAGFAGLVALARTLRLSETGLVALMLLFDLNGFVTAHLAVGHLVFMGVLLLPWLLREVLDWNTRGPARGAPERIALILFAMALAGSFEPVLWCALFFMLLAAIRPGWAGRLIRAGGWTAGLCAVRILPGLVAFPRLTQDFVGGFPDAGHLVAGLLAIRTFRYPVIDAGGHRYGWHEYDFYLGFAGVALMVAGLWLTRLPRLKPLRNAALDLPLAAMALLSLDGAYRLINWIPGFAVERVGTRLLLLPVLMLGTLAIARVDRVAARWRVAGVLAFAAGLGWHAWTWRHTVLAEYFGHAVPRWPVPAPAPAGVFFGWMLAAGAAITLTTAAAVAVRLKAARKG